MTYSEIFNESERRDFKVVKKDYTWEQVMWNIAFVAAIVAISVVVALFYQWWSRPTPVHAAEAATELYKAGVWVQLDKFLLRGIF